MKEERLDDKGVIVRFVEYLNDHGHPGLQIDSWPDEDPDPAMQQGKTVDAIAGSFAIEHTSIEALSGQRERNVWFERVVKGLEASLSPQMTSWAQVQIDFDAVKKGQDWEGIRDRLEAWLLENVNLLSDGRTLVSATAGIPFDFSVLKKHRLKPRLSFARILPEKNDLAERMRSRILAKAEKFPVYRRAGYETFLLLESDDVALMNDDMVVQALAVAFPSGFPDAVRQVWYADTSGQPRIVFTEITEEMF